MIDIKKLLMFLIILIFSANLYAGGIIKIKAIQEDGKEAVQNIYVQDGKMRVEPSINEDQTIIIYDAEKNIVTIINPTEETYTELDENFGKQINNKMEEMLKQLPEDQREAMRAMMTQQMGNMQKQSKPEYKKVGNESINGYNCEVYDKIQSGNTVEKSWITNWDNLKLKDEYIKIFKSMNKFFSKMADNMGDFGETMSSEFDAEMFEKGFPVKTVQYEDGKPVLTEIIKEITEKDLPASLFEVPKNMKKQNAYGDM